MTASTSDWPAYARIVVDGMRIGWRAPISRIQFDDGYVRQAMTGSGATRLVTFDVLVEGDTDRQRFDAWVTALGPQAALRVALPPENLPAQYRLAGGRGAVRWIGTGTAGTRRWWRAQVTCDRVDTFLALATVADQRWALGTSWTLELPSAMGALGTVRYQLTPAPPAGMAWNPATRLISGTPTEILSEPRTYTYQATDEAGRIAESLFGIQIVQVWRRSPDNGQILGNGDIRAASSEPWFPADWFVDSIASQPVDMNFGENITLSLSRHTRPWYDERRLLPAIERRLRVTITEFDGGFHSPVYAPCDGARFGNTITRGQYVRFFDSQGRFGRMRPPSWAATLKNTRGPWIVRFFLTDPA